MTKLILGCGYLGKRVALRWLAMGHTVVATTRDDAHAAELRALGLESQTVDVTQPATLHGLPSAETVLFSVGYDPKCGRSRRQVFVDGLRAVLDALPADTGRILFISSTGVYGDAQGAWVDEDSPCRPMREAGAALLEAERILFAHRLGARAIVLRLAGIYGPDRLIHRRELLAGKPIAVASDAWLNLIHIDDAVEAILAAAERGKPPRVYLVADGHPTDRRTYTRRAAELMGLPAPIFAEVPPGQLSGRHDGSSKRVSSARLRTELGVALKYADFNAGVAAALREQGR